MTTEKLERFERRSGRVSAQSSGRTDTHRDRDRVLYSEAFRRLGGVTQVALGAPNMMLHNRLTHSLKVEQVGISLYTNLSVANSIQDAADQYAVAAACLAHDLGHPPFGHAGEAELHSIVVCTEHRTTPRTSEERAQDPCSECLLEDGFEGNAQSLRILAVLAVHKDTDTSVESPAYGLDLTAATLRAATKYPWLRGDRREKPKKWGAYDCDADVLSALTGGSQDLSLDAQIMDWADDVSYAVHDTEDFYRTHDIPLQQLKEDSQELKEFLAYVESSEVLGAVEEDVKNVLNNLLAFFPTRRFAGRSTDFAELDRARGTLLTRFVNAATTDGTQLRIDPVQKRLNSVIKQLIWYHVIDDPRLTNIQAGQRRVLREIFEALRGPAEEAFKVGQPGRPDDRSLRRLPHGLRSAVQVAMQQEVGGRRFTKAQRVHRGLLDYIAGLSDAEAYYEHSVLKGREVVGHL